MSSALPIIPTDHTSISIKLTHSLSYDGEYGAFTDVEVDILLQPTLQKIGSISAVIVDRQKLPDHYFLSAMDGHSADMQWIGTCLYEPRYGRTKLLSLCEYDDPEFDFMYIKSFQVDEEHRKNGSSDVGAVALHQFLHDPFISGNLDYGCWKVSSTVYVLDAFAAMTKEEETAYNVYTQKRRDEDTPFTETEATDESRQWDARWETLSRQDANQFLRNGFFQDPAIAREGGSAARILVASHGQWSALLKSHEEATAVQFCIPTPMPPAPTGNDAELFSFLKTECSKFYDSQPTPQDRSRIRTEVQRLISLGGAIFKSHGLHVACANNVLDMVKLLLELAAESGGGDADAVNGYDRLNFTPLMVAAGSAAGRKNIDGIREVDIIDYLLAAGAKTSLQDSDGMTAYGHFKKKTADYAQMMQAMMGRSSEQQSSSHGSVHVLERKLLPPGGPTAADLTGGEGPSSGFVDYSQEDKERDREMMGDSSDEDDY
jgi:hypothetical protein